MDMWKKQNEKNFESTANRQKVIGLRCLRVLQESGCKIYEYFRTLIKLKEIKF